MKKQNEIIDPVTGFAIPASWICKSEDPQILEKVKSGRWVLLSDGSLLNRGYTTGTTAAAACKGAVISLTKPVDEVEILTPSGIRVSLPVEGKDGICTATKESGDHEFDVTSGMVIKATAQPSNKTELVAEKGIGRILSKGLCASLGKPAISQSARREIINAIEEGLKETCFSAVKVKLNVPQGQEIANRTLNPKVGVIGGISILGSTGFVEPWNEHMGEDRIAEIKMLDKVVVTTGRAGLKYSRILFPNHKVILVGNKMEGLQFNSEQDSIICGMPALILKWGMPDILEDTAYKTVAEMIEIQPTHPRIDDGIKKVRTKLPHTRIVLLRKDGSILRDERP